MLYLSGRIAHGFKDSNFFEVLGLMFSTAGMGGASWAIFPVSGGAIESLSESWATGKCGRTDSKPPHCTLH